LPTRKEVIPIYIGILPTKRVKFNNLEF